MIHFSRTIVPKHFDFGCKFFVRGNKTWVRWRTCPFVCFLLNQFWLVRSCLINDWLMTFFLVSFHLNSRWKCKWLELFVFGLFKRFFFSRFSWICLYREHLQEVISLLSNEPKNASLPLNENKEEIESDLVKMNFFRKISSGISSLFFQ